MQFIDLAAQQAGIRTAIDAAIKRVLDHGRYIMGPEVAELEAALVDACGAGHAVSCASGTDALVMALLVRAVGPGDAVFVPTFTFASTAEAVALLGATPVFVDVDEADFNLDPQSLADAVAATPEGLNPAGVIAVDLFGQPARYAEIADAVSGCGGWVIADAAQSFGATRAGESVGTMAPLTTTSFFPAKPLGCYGDGGAVFAQDPDDAALLRSVRVHGAGSDKYDNARIGINGRMDTIQAAIVIEKLRVFSDEIEARNRIAARYNEGLGGVAGIPIPAEDVVSVWAQYTLRVDRRDALVAHLGAAGVPSAVYYPIPLHRQTAYRHFPLAPGGAPVSERLAAEVISLPMHPYLSEADQNTVIDAVLSF